MLVVGAAVVVEWMPGCFWRTWGLNLGGDGTGDSSSWTLEGMVKRRGIGSDKISMWRLRWSGGSGYEKG